MASVLIASSMSAFALSVAVALLSGGAATTDTFLLCGLLGLAPAFAALLAGSLVMRVVAPTSSRAPISSIYPALFSASGAAFLGGSTFLVHLIEATLRFEQQQDLARVLMMVVGQILLVAGVLAFIFTMPMVGVELVGSWIGRVRRQPIALPWQSLRLIVFTIVLAFTLRGAAYFLEKNLDPLIMFNLLVR